MRDGEDGERDGDETPGPWLSPTEAAFRKQVLDLIARIEEKVNRLLDERDEQD